MSIVAAARSRSPLIHYTNRMRTTINMQDALMEELPTRSKAQLKSQTVQMAITDYRKRKAAEDLIALSGSIHIDPDWEADEEKELNEYRDHSCSDRINRINGI